MICWNIIIWSAETYSELPIWSTETYIPICFSRSNWYVSADQIGNSLISLYVSADQIENKVLKKHEIWK